MVYDWLNKKRSQSLVFKHHTLRQLCACSPTVYLKNMQMMWILQWHKNIKIWLAWPISKINMLSKGTRQHANIHNSFTYQMQKVTNYGLVCTMYYRNKVERFIMYWFEIAPWVSKIILRIQLMYSLILRGRALIGYFEELIFLWGQNFSWVSVYTGCHTVRKSQHC